MIDEGIIYSRKQSEYRFFDARQREHFDKIKLDKYKNVIAPKWKT